MTAGHSRDRVVLERGVLVYDGLGRHAALVENITFNRLTLLLAPNGGGKTSVLGMFNPILYAPSIAESGSDRDVFELFKAAHVLYSSLRPLPAAAGGATFTLGGRRYHIIWSSMAAQGAIERLGELAHWLEHPMGSFNSALRRVSLKSAEEAVDVLRKLVNDISRDEWKRGEFALRADWESKPSRRRRELYVAGLWAEHDGQQELHALALYDTRGWVAAFVRGEEVLPGLPAYYHPLLAVENRLMVNMFRMLWSALGPAERKRFLDQCSRLVESCIGVDTGFRDSGVVTVALESRTEEGHALIPLAMLGDGQRALLALMLVSVFEKGVVVADTPESFTHPDLLDITSRILVDAADRVNVIVATQSLELIDSLLSHASIHGLLDNIVVHRLYLKRRPGLTTIKSQAINGREAFDAVVEVGVDIRRMELLKA